MIQLLTTPEELQTVLDKALENALNKFPFNTPSTDSLAEIIDSKTLLERLNISEPTLIRWRKKGKIPYLKIGTAIRYDWVKVLKALEAKSRKS